MASFGESWSRVNGERQGMFQKALMFFRYTTKPRPKEEEIGRRELPPFRLATMEEIADFHERFGEVRTYISVV